VNHDECEAGEEGHSKQNAESIVVRSLFHRTALLARLPKLGLISSAFRSPPSFG
jgi:hypothetical protein